MLKVIRESEKFVVALCCDWCGQRITDGRQARCEWPLAADGSPHKTGSVYYAHQGCSRISERYDEATPHNPWHSMPLATFLVTLAGSLQFECASLHALPTLKSLD